MKKSVKVLALLMALCLVLSGCAKKEKELPNYSTGINADGYFEGVKATDYVTLPSLDKIVVSKAEIEKEIQDMLNSPDYMKANENKSTSRVIKDGDTVNIDYVGSIDGKEFSGGSTQGQGTEVIIGVTSYIDNFLEQLIGHVPGDKFDVNVTFPKDYGVEDLNGKAAVFKTTINYVVDYTKNTLNDDFVRDFFLESNGWATVDDLRAGVKGAIAEDVLYDACKFADKMPESVTEAYITRMVADIEGQAKAYGLDVDTFISYAYAGYGFSSMDQVKTSLSIYKDMAAREYMLYQAIAETKDIKVSDADIKEYYDNYGISKSDIKKVNEMYGEPYIKSMALYNKVVDCIHDMAVVE